MHRRNREAPDGDAAIEFWGYIGEQPIKDYQKTSWFDDVREEL